MNDLQLILDDVTFDELVERGRAIIPTAAPAWTDHNTHDPGIMLVELLAWIAESQIYGLARLRRDERLAYAALLGVRPRGPDGARGCIWPPDDANGASWAAGRIIDPEDSLVPDVDDAPVFHPEHRIALVSAALKAVQTRFADGALRDWTAANRKEGATFRPFGGGPRRGDRLMLAFDGDRSSPTPPNGLVALGVDVVRAEGAPAASVPEIPEESLRLKVSVVDARGERPVRLARDTTGGFLRSGVVLLAFDARSWPVGPDFTIVIESASGGFLIAPRVQRIAANVLPVRQIEVKTAQKDPFGTGLPDQTYLLTSEELTPESIVYPIDRKVFQVRTLEGEVRHEWNVVRDLQECDPEDRAVELDTAAGTLRFGNGVNGMVVPAGATLEVQYQICAGTRGNLPPGLAWKLPAGLEGYVNSSAIAGGRAADDFDTLRIATRRRMRRRPCVSRRDLGSRALAFTDLGVMRAYEWVATAAPPRSVFRAMRTLAVVGPRDPHGEASDVTESSEWLREIRRRLLPLLPVGQSLTVVAPRYVEVRVIATLSAEPMVDPAVVREAAEATLRARLAVVAAVPGDPVWPFGRAVTPLAVKGWLRSVDGVARVRSLRLQADGKDAPERGVVLGPLGLPRLHIEPKDIEVERAPIGATS